jgi:hypothetical protein
VGAALEQVAHGGKPDTGRPEGVSGVEGGGQDFPEAAQGGEAGGKVDRGVMVVVVGDGELAEGLGRLGGDRFCG